MSPLNFRLADAPIGVKVALAPLAAVLCLLLVGALGLFANARLTDALTGVVDQQVPRIVNAGTLATRLAAIHSKVNQSLAWEGAGIRAERIEQLDRETLADLKAYDAALAEAVAQPDLTDAERATLGQARKEFVRYADSARGALDIKTGMVANATTFMTTMEKSHAGLSGSLQAMVAEQIRQTRQAADDGKQVAAANRLAILAGLAIAALATVGLSLLMARAIARPLDEAAHIAGAVAHGDLRLRATVPHGTDATGRVLTALEEVSSGLSGVIADIRSAADQVNQASAEIATGNADLSSRTERTAAALQQTSASIEHLSSTIRTSADTARTADGIARDASEVAREGGAVMSDVVSTMDAISERARRIAEIIGVIDGIAFQTNILALNAAVEAARAGEQGRGFSVVASEVRTLAHRSSDAAREIRALIGGSVERIELGVVKVRTAGDTMSRIVAAIERVVVSVREIAEASQLQAGGISEINQAMTDMDQTTQQNAALVEQVSAAAAAMKRQADQLAGMLQRFRTA